MRISNDVDPYLYLLDFTFINYSLFQYCVSVDEWSFNYVILLLYLVVTLAFRQLKKRASFAGVESLRC